MQLKNIILAGIVSGLFQQAEAQKSSGSNGEGKAPKFSKREVDLDSGEVAFVFGDGGEDVVVNPSEFPAEIQKRLMLHGMSQKGGDSFAGVKGNFQLARTNLREVIDQLRAGEWRGGGDEARPRLAELAAAIARIKGLNDEAGLQKATEAVEAASDDQRKSWRSNPQVKAVIAQMRAEKAAKALEGQKPEDIQINI